MHSIRTSSCKWPTLAASLVRLANFNRGKHLAAFSTARQHDRNDSSYHGNRRHQLIGAGLAVAGVVYYLNNNTASALDGQPDESKLKTDRDFWTNLFDDHQLAKRLAAFARQPDGVVVDGLDVTIRTGSALGDNFMSDTFIVEAGHRDAFVKLLPSNCMLRQTASQGRIHQREIGVYRDLFDALRAIRGDLPIPLDVPALFYCQPDASVDGGSAVCTVMENLQSQAYAMVNKIRGCDDDHARLALTSLAHYHALTTAAVRRWTADSCDFPDETKFVLEKTLMDIEPPLEMMHGYLDKFIELADHLGRRDVVDWLRTVKANVDEHLLLDNLKTSGPMACILHGDFWCNNMLFKYDDLGRPVAVKMVDFQIARIGNPVTDLLYFLYTSTLPELREESMGSLLRHYYDTVTADLKLLGVEPDWTFDHLLDECKKRSIGMMIYAGVVMMFILSQSVVDNLNEQNAELKASGGDREEQSIKADQTAEVTMTKELQDQMNDIVTKQTITDNEVLSERLVKLFVQVKQLNGQ